METNEILKKNLIELIEFTKKTSGNIIEQMPTFCEEILTYHLMNNYFVLSVMLLIFLATIGIGWFVYKKYNLDGCEEFYFSILGCEIFIFTILSIIYIQEIIQIYYAPKVFIVNELIKLVNTIH